MHRSAFVPTALVAAALLAACGDSATLDDGAGAQERPAPPAASAEPLDDPALQALREDANQLLDGGTEAYQARLEELRGTPVVVNQWASWCPPCRAEFPIFQQLSEELEGEVAFLGVDMQDGREAALEFMDEFPTRYPHYFDEDASIARLIGGGRVSPTTGFYNADGELTFSHLGAYTDVEQLEAEIRKYALG